MAITYRLRSNASDLANKNLVATQGSTSGSAASGNLNPGGSAVFDFITVLGLPSSNGTSTGSFSVEVDVQLTTPGSETNAGVVVTIARTNSSGTIQNSAVSSEQSATTNTTLTFNFTNPSLGTWASGNRYLVSITVYNRNTTDELNITVNLGTTNAEVVTPFAEVNSVRTVSSVAAALQKVGATRTISSVAAHLQKLGATRTVSSVTAALQQTNTRTVSSVAAALQATNTRSLSSVVAALQQVGVTRAVPASAALLATNTRAVPSTAALQATNARAVSVSAALQALGLTRTISDVSVALVTGSTRLVPVEAALVATNTREISGVTAALAALGVTRSVSAAAALVATNSREISALAALTATPTRVLPATAELLTYWRMGRRLVMGYPVQLNQTAQPLIFMLVQATDGRTPLTGATPTVTLRKPGGAFASPSGAVSEIGNGHYQVAGHADDTNVLGPLALHATAAGADPADYIFQVVNYNPLDNVRLGLTALPNAAVAASGGLPTIGSSAGQITLANGKVTVGTNDDKSGYALTSGERDILADKVWDEAAADHNAAGSFGQKLNAAGGASDPLTNEVPGNYAQDTAGYVLGQLVPVPPNLYPNLLQPFLLDGELRIAQGDDYLVSNGRALEITRDSAVWPPDLTGATITVTFEYNEGSRQVHQFNVSGAVVVATGVGQKVRWEMSNSVTTPLYPGTKLYEYQVRAVVSGVTSTLRRGRMTVFRDLST